MDDRQAGLERSHLLVCGETSTSLRFGTILSGTRDHHCDLYLARPTRSRPRWQGPGGRGGAVGRGAAAWSPTARLPWIGSTMRWTVRRRRYCRLHPRGDRTRRAARHHRRRDAPPPNALLV